MTLMAWLRTAHTERTWTMKKTVLATFYVVALSVILVAPFTFKEFLDNLWDFIWTM